MRLAERKHGWLAGLKYSDVLSPQKAWKVSVGILGTAGRIVERSFSCSQGDLLPVSS